MSELPAGWDLVALGEIAQIQRGIAYSSDELVDSDQGILMVNLRSIAKGGGFRSDGYKYWSGSPTASQLIGGGDLLIATTDLSKAKDVLGSPVLIPNSVPAHGATFSTDLVRLSPQSTRIMLRYLYYVLQGPASRNFMKENGGGTTVMHLRMKALPKFEVPVPPLDEQRRIVEILDDHFSRLDTVKSALSHQLVLIKRLRRSAVQSALAEHCAKSGTQPLETVVEILDSMRVPVSAEERSIRRGDVPYYGATGPVGSIDRSIFDEPLVLLGEDGVQFFDPDKPKAYIIDGPSWVNNHAHVLRVRQDSVDRQFLLHVLNALDYRGLANGTTRLKLTQGAMKRIPVPSLPIEAQRDAVESIEQMLRVCDDLDAVRVNTGRRLVMLRRSLLHAAFTGQLTKEFRND